MRDAGTDTAKVVAPEALAGVRVVELKPYPDPRGFFVETYRQEWFPGCKPMIQGNRSDSSQGVLRGLHFHRRQADYWYVTKGRMLAALADLRPNSPTWGCVATVELGGERELGLYIPSGVAHGYYALTDATMTYMVDQYYDNTDEFGVAWNDPELGIPWPFTGEPLLSQRDRENPRTKDLDPATLVTL